MGAFGSTSTARFQAISGARRSVCKSQDNFLLHFHATKIAAILVTILQESPRFPPFFLRNGWISGNDLGFPEIPGKTCENFARKRAF